MKFLYVFLAEDKEDVENCRKQMPDVNDVCYCTHREDLFNEVKWYDNEGLIVVSKKYFFYSPFLALEQHAKYDCILLIDWNCAKLPQTVSYPEGYVVDLFQKYIIKPYQVDFEGFKRHMRQLIEFSYTGISQKS